MKIIPVCLILSLMTHAFLKASDVDPLSPTEESTILATPPTIIESSHLDVFEAYFPPLSTPEDMRAKHDLIVRIDRLYGAHLKANPNFCHLITPLINIEADATGNHMSFVWSDCRLSYLKLYAETIKPPIFTYDDA